jgi:hypothetical protein
MGILTELRGHVCKMSFPMDKSRPHTVEIQMARFSGTYSFCIAVSLSVIHLVVRLAKGIIVYIWLHHILVKSK